ncbi:MAG TPA: cell wall hydrolase [Ruminococcaceae bacterium]|nr:cell wall hydrolase [Oscillospiraceae bacterium]
MRLGDWALSVIAIVILGLVATGAAFFIRNHDLAKATDTLQIPTVIIDPGHGGPDGGAVGTDGNYEKDINLAISLKLRNFFLIGGYRVIMTREDDRSIYDKGSNSIREKKVTDIHNRFKIAEEHPKALFLSIHQNLYTDSQYNGAQMFYSTNNPASKILAQNLQDEIHNLIQPQNERIVKPAGDNLYILYHTHTPAVLAECGFVSNPTENRNLQKEEYQNKMAFSIYCGTLHYQNQANSVKK